MIVRRKILKRTAVNGWEEDAFYARQYYHWKPGSLKQIKRTANKRQRKLPIEQGYFGD